MSSSSFSSGVRSIPHRAAPQSVRLAVVPRLTARAPRVPFVALVVGLLAVGLVGLLVLNTSLQRGAYVVTDLRTSAAQLSLREQNLETQVSRLQSPARLAAVAAASGMVRGDNPAFLSLATGKVVGVPKPGRPANSVDLYGGSTATPSSKLPLVPAGSHNTESTGLQRQAPAPTEQRSSMQTRRGATVKRHEASTGGTKHSDVPRATPRSDRRAR